MTRGAGSGGSSHMEVVEMLGVSFREVNCKLRYHVRVWRFGINESIPALPKMCVNEWAGKEKERRKKEIRENESSQAQCQPSQYQYTIWLVSVRLCYNAIFMGGANNFLFPFGRFLIPVLRRTSLHPSHRNHPPPPGASVRSTFIVYMALKYVPVSARFHKRCDLLQMDYVKTLPFLWSNDSNEISLGGC